VLGMPGRHFTPRRYQQRDRFPREIRLFPKFCLSDLPLRCSFIGKSLYGLQLKCAQIRSKHSVGVQIVCKNRRSIALCPAVVGYCTQLSAQP
jgi:hypothetical protein